MNTKSPNDSNNEPKKKNLFTQASQSKKPIKKTNQRMRIILLLAVVIVITAGGLSLFSLLSETQPETKNTAHNKQAEHINPKSHSDTLKRSTPTPDTAQSSSEQHEPISSDGVVDQQEQAAQIVEQQAHNALHMAEAMDAIDQINQAIVSIRISYQQLSNQQDISNADAWLKLAIQPIKRARLIDDVENKLLGSVASLREKITTIQKPDLNAVIADLQTFQDHIHKLSKPSKLDANQPESGPSTETPPTSEKQQTPTTILGQWQQSISHQLHALYDWAINSIQIDHIDDAQYHTFRHTIGARFFQDEMQLLINQATIAVTFNDQKTFDYLCAQIQSQIQFHIQEPKIQKQLVDQIKHIQQQPITIKIPDYLPLIEACQEVLHQLHPINMRPPVEKANQAHTEAPVKDTETTHSDPQIQQGNKETLSFLNIQAAKT